MHIFPSFDFTPLNHPYIASKENVIWIGVLPVSKLAKKFNLKLTRKQYNLLIEILELIFKDAHKVIRGNRVATQYETLAKKTSTRQRNSNGNLQEISI